MSIGLKNNIINQKGTPAFFSDVFANRPAAGYAGRVFISTDTGAIYEDTGSAWTLISNVSSGAGTLEQVTTNGNTTTKGIVVTSGNVAIGTATAGAPLDIHATGVNAQFNGTGTNNAYLQFQNAGSSKWRIGNTYSANANTFDLYNNQLSNTALSFNSSTNNASFNGGLRITGLADQQLWVYGSSPSLRIYDTTTSPTIAGFVGMATSVNNFIQGSAFGDLAIGTSTGGKILIGTANGTVSSQITITSTGNIGIGNSSPTTSLDVISANNNAINIASTSSTNVSTTYKYNTNVVVGLIGNGASISTGGNSADFGIQAINNIIFSTTNSATEQMRLNNSGNLLIGTTTDNGNKLQVQGVITSSQNLQIIKTASNSVGSGPFTALVNSGNLYQIIQQLNASYGLDFYSYQGSFTKISNINQNTGIYTPLSDINKKKDFEQSMIGLDAILNLKPTLFRMKNEDQSKDKSLGFIAQEVREFIPQAYVEENEFIGLSDRPIIAALVKAIQELNNKIENLKN